MTKQERQTELADVQKQLDVLNERMRVLAVTPTVGGPWHEWPMRGDIYWYVDDEGLTNWERWSMVADGSEDDVHDARKTLGNVFRTEQEAEQHKLRLESMAQRWRPENQSHCWYWSMDNGQARELYWNRSSDGALDTFFYGNCHPTREAAEAWGARYGDAWKALLRPIA